MCSSDLVIPQEYAHIRCRNIDVVIPQESSEQFEQCIAALVTELTTPITDQIVAYRNRFRWVPTFEPLPLKANADALPLRKEGVYLIAGDLVEGLGYTILRSPLVGDYFQAYHLLHHHHHQISHPL